MNLELGKSGRINKNVNAVLRSLDQRKSGEGFIPQILQMNAENQ